LLLLDAGEFGQNWIVAKVAEALGTTTRSLEHLKTICRRGVTSSNRTKKMSQTSTGNSIWG
jgi:hypothetical protein